MTTIFRSLAPARDNDFGEFHEQGRTSFYVFLPAIQPFSHWQGQPREVGCEDQQGLRGGLFVDRAQALKFAMFENGNRPQAVILVPGVLELDIGRHPAHRISANVASRLQRVA